jgi:hypothetical protein
MITFYRLRPDKYLTEMTYNLLPHQEALLNDALTEYITYHVTGINANVEDRRAQLVNRIETRGKWDNVQSEMHRLKKLELFDNDTYVREITSDEFWGQLREYLSDPQNFIDSDQQETYWPSDDDEGGGDDDLQCFLDNAFLCFTNGGSIDPEAYVGHSGDLYTPRDSLIMRYMKDVIIPQCHPSLVEDGRLGVLWTQEVFLDQAVTDLIKSSREELEFRVSSYLASLRLTLKSWEDKVETIEEPGKRANFMIRIESFRRDIQSLESFDIDLHLLKLDSEEFREELKCLLLDDYNSTGWEKCTGKYRNTVIASHLSELFSKASGFSEPIMIQSIIPIRRDSKAVVWFDKFVSFGSTEVEVVFEEIEEEVRKLEFKETLPTGPLFGRAKL